MPNRENFDVYQLGESVYDWPPFTLPMLDAAGTGFSQVSVRRLRQFVDSDRGTTLMRQASTSDSWKESVPRIAIILSVAAIALMESVSHAQSTSPTDDHSRPASDLTPDQGRHGPTHDSLEASVSRLDDEYERVLKLVDEKQVDEAIALQRKVLDQRIAKYGKKHWQTIESRLLLDVLTTASRMTARQIEEARLIATLQESAYRDSQLGRHEHAVVALYDAMVRGARVWGKDSPVYAQLLLEVAEAYANWDSLKQAIEFALKANEIQVKVSGNEHPQTIRSLKLLAMLYDKDQKYSKSDVAARKAFEAAKVVYGLRTYPYTEHMAM